ncbi:MAG: protein translocase subunit SecF [Geminicoccaceae bacterium]
MSFRLVPDQTKIPFMSFRKIAVIFSGVLALLSVVLLPTKGLNLGIDFAGGTMTEVRMPGDAADIGAMRTTLNDLDLGEVTLQTFGEDTDVLIRVERQEGDEAGQVTAVEQQIKQALGEHFGEGIEYRRTEFVSPTVSSELYWASAEAILFALIAILAYIWFRFEWQFAVGSIVALVHDVVLTLGVFSLLGLEFNLATVAALLTIVGYSLNDTVVVFDRVRENLRKYKKMLLPDLLDRSLNDTLARTLMTSVTTLLALAALFIFGGPVIRDFTFALIWGVLIGTYSSIFIASPILLSLNLRADQVALPSAAENATP